MISEFQGKRRIFTFPKAWANAVVRWIAGVHSPNGTMEISNTLNPGDDGSLGLDVNLDAVVDKVKVRLGFDKRSPLDRNDVRDIVFDLLDGASVINSGRRVAVNLDWLNANIGQGEGGGAVSSVNGKTGAVVLTYTDVGAASSDDLDTVSESLEELIDVVDGIVDDYLSSADIGVTVAAVDHTHDGYAAAEHTHTGYAASDHNHTGVYAAYSHTHDGYAASNHNHNGVYATVSHTHGVIDSIGELKKYSGTSLVNANDAVVGTSSSGYIGAIEGMLATGLKKIYDAFTISTSDAKLAVAKVDFGSGVTNVTSSNLASQAATAGLLTKSSADGYYAAASHVHTGYAASNHTHSGYAAATHTHGQYASTESLNALSGSVEELVSVVDGIVADYVTSADLTTRLSVYSTTSDINTQLANYALLTDLDDYLSVDEIPQNFITAIASRKSGNFTLITDIQFDGTNLQKKTQQITVTQGVITNIGTASAWSTWHTPTVITWS